MVRTAMLGLLCTGVCSAAHCAPSQSASGAAAPGAPAEGSFANRAAFPAAPATCPVRRLRPGPDQPRHAA